MVVGFAWGLVKIFKDDMLDVHIALFKMDNQQGLTVKKGFFYAKNLKDSMLDIVLVSWGCYSKIASTRWLRQQTCISHNSGGWEVQDQGTGRPSRQVPSHCVPTWPREGAVSTLFPFSQES